MKIQKNFKNKKILGRFRKNKRQDAYYHDSICIYFGILNYHFFCSGQSNSSKNLKPCRLHPYNSSNPLEFLQNFS